MSIADTVLNFHWVFFFVVVAYLLIQIKESLSLICTERNWRKWLCFGTSIEWQTIERIIIRITSIGYRQYSFFVYWNNKKHLIENSGTELSSIFLDVWINLCIVFFPAEKTNGYIALCEKHLKFVDLFCKILSHFYSRI